ncbi:MAG: hypothetical protein JWN63_2573 [Candidatus Acidoferrum typicum]|nr:hypothetical protein [Candidatus Acidoferrum typicum]
MSDVPNFIPGPVGPPNYVQPDYRNPVANPAIGATPVKNGNPMALSWPIVPRDDTGGPGSWAASDKNARGVPICSGVGILWCNSGT